MRLFVNFFQPSFKLAEKSRDGAVVKKRYHSPATPYQRLLDDGRVSDDVRERLRAVAGDLDPVRLLREIRLAQARLAEIADRAAGDFGTAPQAATLAEFLAGLRTAWKEGEVRPTARAKPKVTRGRRRPDPLVAVTGQLRRWFDAEPWRTSRELLARLQAEVPDTYPEALLRTLQRRVKHWRGEAARGLVFGSPVGLADQDGAEAPGMAGAGTGVSG